jgi:hypothetical protein
MRLAPAIAAATVLLGAAPAVAQTHPPVTVGHVVDQHLPNAKNSKTKTADLPTGDWYGTIKAHGQGNIYNDTLSMDFAFSVGADGVVKGKGHAKMTNAQQQNGPCLVTLKRVPDETDVAIRGRLVDNEFKLELEKLVVPTTVTQRPVNPARPGCLTGSRTFRISFFAPMPLARSFSDLTVRAKDGATNSLDTVVGSFHITGTIRIHQGRQSGH